MKNLGLNEIRETFLQFFQKKDHLRMKSASLVPQNDKSLLIINSGMAPLKPYFTGLVTPPSKRVATCQKCIRTNDIENVGVTSRHASFFEMLGNFSFGDYFKEEIILWSWEFLTEVLEIPENKLYPSVYFEDDEAYNIWHEKMGLPKDKIFRLGKDDNFWEVGLGPCGPCSEIYFDRGEEFGCGKPDCTVGCDCDRFMEVWNLVFTQFNKEEDGSYSNLAQKNIDTGMGLERLSAALQGVTSIFDVDTIRAIRDRVCEISGVTYGKDSKTDVSVRVITDHIRAITFMVSDGILPSNEGRGYVLRRLLRRAAGHGKRLGIDHVFLAKLSETVIEISGDAYPELREKQDYILKLLTVEENRFYETLDSGIEILAGMTKNLKGDTLPGADAFKLYDTYGFPLDMVKEYLAEQILSVNEDEFYSEMEKQRQRGRSSRESSNYMGAEETVYDRLDPSVSTEFTGYDCLKAQSEIIYLIAEDELTDTAQEGQKVSIITAKTPFYGESGGQAGDIGTIETETGAIEITNCIKLTGGKMAHLGQVVNGEIKQNQQAMLFVNKANRQRTCANHSATHLLQKALRQVLGGHVEQSGSLVTNNRLRFDFTHFAPVTSEELRQVEDIVNEQILNGIDINAQEMSIEEAKSLGAMALFGEKYGDVVRVVTMGDFSRELCGGTHLKNTALVGSFKILSEGGVAAGVRRIEAATGKAALEHYRLNEDRLLEIASIIKAPVDGIAKKIEANLQTQREMARELEQMKSQRALAMIDDFILRKEIIKGFNVVTAGTDGMDMNELRQLGDKIRDRLQSGIVILASGTADKGNMLIIVSDDIVAKGVHAGNMIKAASKVADGSGGGKANMAQGGFKNVSKMLEAIRTAKEMI